MLRLCDVVRAKFFMGPKQLKQLLAEGGPKPLPAHVAANALAATQRWRTDQAATGGIVPRPGMPASAGTVEAMAAGLNLDLPLPAGVSGLLTGAANAPMSVSSRAIAPTGSEDEDEDGCTSSSSGSEAAAAMAATAGATAEIVKPSSCAGKGCCDVPAKAGNAKDATKKGRRGRGGRNNAAVAA